MVLQPLSLKEQLPFKLSIKSIMITLKGETIYLRALEPNDLEFVYAIENDQSIWAVSNTHTPYSRFLVKQYLECSTRHL
jgi:hypothetical protein